MPRKVINHDPISGFLPDRGHYDNRLKEIAYDYVRDAIQRGVKIGAAEIDIQPSFDVLNPDVIDFINNYTIRLAGSVNDTVIGKIRDSISDGLQQGLTYPEMRDSVLESMGCARGDNGNIIADDAASYRAEMIARTETDRAQNAGRDAQLTEAGAKIARWRANPGCCEFCAEMDGMEVAVGENFFQQGDQIIVTDDDGNERGMLLDYADTPYPPLHPNCLCVVEYDF